MRAPRHNGEQESWQGRGSQSSQALGSGKLPKIFLGETSRQRCGGDRQAVRGREQLPGHCHGAAPAAFVGQGIMTTPTTAMARWGRAPLLGLLRVYRFAISPVIGPACRFEPTCSVYAEQAIQRFGACKGGYLALRRILRCHPFARAGLDPVPCPAPPVSRTRSDTLDGRAKGGGPTLSPPMPSREAALPAKPAGSARVCPARLDASTGCGS